MLTLNLSGHQIPVPKDFSLRLTWKSPMCDFEKVPTGYSLGITIPSTDYTRSLLRNPQRFTKGRGPKDNEFPDFEIRFGGILMMSGTLSIVSTSLDSFECSLIDQVGVMNEKQADKTLPEMEVFTQELPLDTGGSYNPSTHQYCMFPVGNQQFFAGKGVLKTYKFKEWNNEGKKPKQEVVDKEMEFWSHEFFVNTQGVVNAKHLVSGQIRCDAGDIWMCSILKFRPTPYPITVVSPFFYLNWVVESALKSELFYLGKNPLRDDPLMQRLCIYNNFDVTKTQPRTLGYLTLHPHPDPDPYLIFWSLFWNNRPELVPLFERSYDVPVVPKNHLPKMSVGEMIISTQNLLNVAFHFLPDKTVNVYQREKVLDGPALSLQEYFTGVWEMGEAACVTLKFTREHDTNDQAFSEWWEDLSDRKDDFKDSVASLAELLALPEPQEGEIRYVRDSSCWMEYKWHTPAFVEEKILKEVSEEVLGWVRVSIGWQPVFYEYGRDENEEIKSSWGCLYGLGQITQVFQPGNMNVWKTKKTEFTPRLCIQESDTRGGYRSPAFSFEYDEPGTGLLDLYWRKWSQFWANRQPVTGRFDLPIHVLRFLIYNICSKFRTDEGEFLIEEMSCELYVDHIGQTEIKGFKVE